MKTYDLLNLRQEVGGHWTVEFAGGTQAGPDATEALKRSVAE
jgi:hypothetical protein